MKKNYFLLLTWIFICKISYSQTTTIIGVMSVYNLLGGLGCDASCDEGSYYGSYNPYTFCNTGAAVGAGSATEQPMYTSFYIPTGCSVVVNAEYGAPYREHGVCSDSRMDAGDLIGIANTTVTNSQISAGTVTNVGTCAWNAAYTIGGPGTTGVVAAGCSGANNTDQSVAYASSGPITISVYGHANRSDEAITYTVTGTGSSCSTIGVIVLPIELIGFGAYVNSDNNISINWSTATETNNDYFMVEYSFDGKNFIDFKEVKGAGNSTSRKDYSCIFTIDIENKTPYFRLKQVDLNGNFKYSAVVELGTLLGYTKTTVPANIYYNMEKEKIVVDFHLDYSQGISLLLYNLQGREIYKLNETFKEGDNSIMIDKPETQGIYSVVYSHENTLPVYKKIMVTGN